MTVPKWNEDELKALLGSEESLHLEFKSGLLFEKDINAVAEDLSKVMSAFANTEGGRLVLGISEEKRGKARVASQLDGLAASTWPSHRIQQLLESNIHPPLTGVRVYSVALSGGDRVAFVVEVPQGRTAHQAKDCRYYGRSEFETRPLRDFDIRLRMERGKTPFADVEALLRLSRSADDVLQELAEDYRRNLTELAKHLAPDPTQVPEEIAVMDSTLRAIGADKPHLIDLASLGKHRYRFHEYEIEFRLRNAGERTIREFEVQISAEAAGGCGVTECQTERRPISPQPSGGFYAPDDIAKYRQLSLRVTERDCVKRMTNGKLWPGATCVIACAILLLPDGSVTSDVALATWTVFLDDVLPKTGRIEFAADQDGRLTMRWT